MAPTTARERGQEATDRPHLVREVLAGRLHLDDINPDRIDFVMVGDEIAQTGQGKILDRANEHLGRSDTGVILLRKMWQRSPGDLIASFHEGKGLEFGGPQTP